MVGHSKDDPRALGQAAHRTGTDILIVVNAFVNLTLSDKVARIALCEVVGVNRRTEI
jgi:hypothetical protein